MKNANTITGYDFFFKVKKGGKVTSVECVRLYGSSVDWMDARRDIYAKDGFTIEAATEQEYRAANWKKAA